MTAVLSSVNARRAQFNRDVILTATPAHLLTMLYDRLLLDLHRAETAQEAEDWQTSSDNLLHAQEIVAELSSSLDLDVWDGADALLGVYNFVARALIYANTNRDIASTRLCTTLIEPLRQSWHEAAQAIPAGAALSQQALSGLPTGVLGVA
jgi:flagellar protein FliS